MTKTKKTETESVVLLRKALKQFDKFEKDDLYGYSNVGLKAEKSAKKVKREIEKFLN